MHSSGRARERRQLERELQTEAYESNLCTLQRNEPGLDRFQSWLAVAQFMHEDHPTSQKDQILRAILTAHAGDRDHQWRTILLVVFWPALLAIHARKRWWDSDADELWANLLWIFLRVICRIDVRRRPHRIAQKIYWDTYHDLHELYERDWAWSEIHRLESEGWGDSPGIAVRDRGIEEVEAAVDKENCLRRLRHLRDRGAISETDFFILVATEVYEQPLQEYAEEAGLSYEAAKKRRQRAKERYPYT